jgi:hypothetical protein
MLRVLLGLMSALAVAGGIWIVGCGLVRERPAAERLAAGICAWLAVAWICMAQPLLGISVVAHRWLAVTLLVLAVGLSAARAGRSLMPSRGAIGPVVAILPAAVVVSLPLVLVRSSTAPGPDMRWHEGWIRELSGGVDPAGPYSGIPNSYPWLYHSLSSWLQLLPGGMTDLFWAQESFALIALATGMWLLARELGFGRWEAGWSVFLVSTAAGVGWFWIHQPTASFVTGRGVYSTLHGDFIVSGGLTPALALLPPLYPRDLSLSLVPLAVWLIVCAVRTGERRRVILAGFVMGAMTLIGPVEALVVGGVAVVVFAVFRRDVRLVLEMFGTWLLVSAVWLVPFGVHYVNLGGLLPKTAKPSVTLVEAATGIGLLDRRMLWLVIGVPVGFCVLTWLASAGITGAGPLGRAQRYLPIVAVMLALPAGLAVAAVGRRHLSIAVVLLLALAAASDASFVLTSLGLVDRFRTNERMTVFQCPSSVNIAAGQTVAVVNASTGPGRRGGILANTIDDDVFRNTGAYVLFRRPPAQIRYTDTFKHTATQGQRARWIHQLESGIAVPEADWVLTPRLQPVAGLGQAVATCDAGKRDGGTVHLLLYRIGG